MNKGELYGKVSRNIQTNDAIEVIEKCRENFTWTSDGSDALLDIGCGDGFVTAELVTNAVPSDTKIDAIDMCEEMIACARNSYGNARNLNFFLMNIEDDIVGDVLKPESYNVVTSFLALHYVENLRKAFENIYKLLKKDGKLVFQISIYSPLPKGFRALHDAGKHKNVKLGYNKSFFFESEIDQEQLFAMMNDVGFEITFSEVNERIFEFRNLESAIKMMTSLKIITEADATEEFMNDFGSIFPDFRFPFRFLIVAARK